MARYNTTLPTTTVSAAGTITIPQQGLFTEFSGTAPYSVTIPDPTIYFGQTQTFYNSTSGTITLTSPTGSFTGPGGSTGSSQSLPAGASIQLGSDSNNYVVIGGMGGPLIGTTLTATGNVGLSGSNATITISPTGSGTLTVNPGTIGTINNMNIGGTIAGTGAFTTLSASSTVSGTGFSTYLASPPAIGGTTPAAGSFTSLTSASGYTATHNGPTQINGSFTVASSQTISMGSNRVTNVADPSSLQDALTLNYFQNNITKTSAALFFYGTF